MGILSSEMFVFMLLQFLQITVCDVMGTPVWHSIKLNAMGKLHLVFCVEPPNLLSTFRLAPSFSKFVFRSLLSTCEVDKFVLLESFAVGLVLQANTLPSSFDRVLLTCDDCRFTVGSRVFCADILSRGGADTC